jgi:prepilin-type N-terminal cleavage/methylation domain-containing protein/prepilin-type processing-associated H-X9-DG protein
MRLSRRGFTLIELLVVIAIIGILAAMLFPVFARAREAARKTQCLSNVKNMAMAVQIYLTDYDAFPNSEKNADAFDYFSTCPGGGNTPPRENCNRTAQANPFLRWHVIFDEYVKSRDIYRCPSATLVIGAQWIVPNYDGGYLNYLKETEGKWGRARRGSSCNGDCGGPCGLAWPPGWGGTVTDSIAQNMAASGGTGWTEVTLAYTQLQDVKTAQIGDPTYCVVCGDSTQYTNILGWQNLVYSIWSFCDTTSHPECGILSSDLEAQWNADPSFRSKYSRHMGGGNVGFADGHAKWWTGPALEAATPYCDCACPTQTILKDGRPLRGLCPLGVAE